MISHDYITVNSSSVAFDFYTKIQTSYHDEYWISQEEFHKRTAIPFTVEGIELDLRMRGFEFFNLVSSYPFDSPRPVHLKATGKIKFQGQVLEPCVNNEQDVVPDKEMPDVQLAHKGNAESLVGEISISGLKLNQLMVAPQLAGLLTISRERIKVMA